MLNCKELTELATDYLEGDLSWHSRALVRLHLAMCQHCRRYLAQMRTVVELLKRLSAATTTPLTLPETLLSQFRQTREKQA